MASSVLSALRSSAIRSTGVHSPHSAFARTAFATALGPSKIALRTSTRHNSLTAPKQPQPNRFKPTSSPLFRAPPLSSPSQLSPSHLSSSQLSASSSQSLQSLSPSRLFSTWAKRQPIAPFASNTFHSNPNFQSLRSLASVVGAVGFLTVTIALSGEVAADSDASSNSGNAQPNSTETKAKPNSTDSPFADMKIFSGRANVALAREIASTLGVPLGAISIKCYADGEIGIQVNENVRGKDVYIIQPTCPPGVNDHLVELILMVSTMRRASARKITAVIPYYGYARQDRKMASRVPISAADVARLLQAMGVDRVVAVDLHCGQIQGFFGPRTPCDNLEGHIVALPYFQQLGLVGATTKVVSPDAGGVYRAKRFRDGLKKYGIDAGLAMIIKQRLQANQVGKMDLVGTVDGCDVIIVDDMIDTAGTLTLAASELKARGAKRVFCFATHGLFSGPAHDRIAKSTLEKVIVLNTVPLAPSGVSAKVIQLSCAGLLSEAIARIHTKKSVSALFDRVSND